MAGQHAHLVITNNDVIFMPNWDRYLRLCFKKEELGCGMAGPVTNQPGHAPWQYVPMPEGDDFELFTDGASDFVDQEDNTSTGSASCSVETGCHRRYPTATCFGASSRCPSTLGGRTTSRRECEK
jgi:hypothetical protein